MPHNQNHGFHFDNSYLSLPSSFYQRVTPAAASHPELVIFNTILAETLGLAFSDINSAEQAAILSGQTLLAEGGYFAQAYAGQQIGHFTTLGDGRAIMLGEHLTPEQQRVDIQFKGSGRTPYSRQGDGKAALGPMLREYIISESMHALGIPTTRSLAVVTTGDTVLRETPLAGAILTRVARSHLRVGTFEFAARQEGKDTLQALVDYTVQRHYPGLVNQELPALALLQAVIAKQVALVVDWMRVGFIHGVMNTDNMTLSGETIDYGPCAFMDVYDPNTVFSAIDQNGRYAYQNQPLIAQWNLARFAETLLPLLSENQTEAIDIAQDCLSDFADQYQQQWLAMMRHKLGLLHERSEDAELISDLLTWMHKAHADFTLTFRELSQLKLPEHDHYQTDAFQTWYARWQTRLQHNSARSEQAIALMQRTNPAVIPRNHLVEQSLEAAYDHDFTPFHELLAALKTPYDDPHHTGKYQRPPSPEERVYQTFCGT